MTLVGHDEMTLREPLEGQLLKFTNVVMGWQFRLFRLDPESGTLEYHIVEEVDRQRPRGLVHLAGAVVSPSDEDSQTFTISAATGDIYRLKANDAKERQYWITRLRSVVEQCNQNLSMAYPIPSKEAFAAVEDQLGEAFAHHVSMANYIDRLPLQDGSYKCYQDLLMLKSTSAALLLTLDHCLAALQYFQSSCSPVHSSSSSSTLPVVTGGQNNGSGEIPDKSPDPQEEPEREDTYRSVAVPLLASLKLGAELTAVRLPTAVLKPLSLLELWAICLGHPEPLLRIAEETSPLDQLAAVVRWYLMVLCAGWKEKATSKPLTPLLGETFHCSWRDGGPHVTFLAEQVSRHPPVSALYMECPERKLALEATIGPTCRFLGTSLAITLSGQLKLSLPEGLWYQLTLPVVSVNNLATCPCLELSGRVSVTSSVGASAHITFIPQNCADNPRTLTGDIREGDQSQTSCKLSGDWRGLVDLAWESGHSDQLDLCSTSRPAKYVRPIEQQDDSESRRLWAPLMAALKSGDLQAAEDCRNQIEAKALASQPYAGKLFRQDGEVWMYKYPLLSVS